MAKIDHYMVDFLGEGDKVEFANDTPITNLTKAKSLAAKESRQNSNGAYVVAYTAEGADQGKFIAVGHISFYEGRQSETDGQVL